MASRRAAAIRAQSKIRDFVCLPTGLGHPENTLSLSKLGYTFNLLEGLLGIQAHHHLSCSA